MAVGDKILAQARLSSIQLEGLAAAELRDQIDSYLPPSYGARQMVEAFSGYTRAGTNSQDAYYNFRSTFTETRGVSHQVFSKVLASHIRAEKHPLTRSMFQVEDAAATIRAAVRSMNVNGMWKARFLVPDNLVQSLKEKTLARFEQRHGDKIQAMLDGAPGCEPQVKSNYDWVTTFEEMYEISSDPLLLSIVQDYIGVPPIFDTPVVFLNSTAPLDDRGLSDTAQLYHHDLHRLQFVKLFIYLTDVDAGSGPHAMIPGTHRSRPDHMWSDGRHSDEKVAKSGLLDGEVRITGKAGTLFMVDTTALHKGVHPVDRSRLLAQVQYSNSMFGKPVTPALRVLHQSRTAEKDNEDIQTAAALVKKYAEKSGVRFMQSMI